MGDKRHASCGSITLLQDLVEPQLDTKRSSTFTLSLASFLLHAM